MALAIDASTPAAAVATNTTATSQTATTASFTPPANSLLVVLFSVDGPSSGTVTRSATDNLGVHLSYSERVAALPLDSPVTGGGVIIWTAPVTSSAAMTVSATATTNSGAADCYLQVVVVTGGGSTPTVGATGKAASATASTSIAASYTATAAGSWGFAGVHDWNATGSMTAGTGCTVISTGTPNATLSSYGFARRTTADGVSGSATTITVNMGGSSSAKHIALVEILDPGAPAAPAAPPPGVLYIGPTRR